MHYPAPHSSVLLTSTGTWSFVVIAICACCAAVGFLWSNRPGRKMDGSPAGPELAREIVRPTSRCRSATDGAHRISGGTKSALKTSRTETPNSNRRKRSRHFTENQTYE